MFLNKSEFLEQLSRDYEEKTLYKGIASINVGIHRAPESTFTTTHHTNSRDLIRLLVCLVPFTPPVYSFSCSLTQGHGKNFSHFVLNFNANLEYMVS